MTTAGLILACLAAVIHIYIFYLESVAWTSPKTRAIFGVSSAAEAETTRQLAFNQGFYNLFLAVCVIAGTVFFAVGEKTIGATLVFTGAGSMTAAGLILLLSSPDKASAALKQLVPPLLGVIVLAIGLV